MAQQVYAIISARALRDRRLTSHHIHLLAALGMHVDENGWAYPSRKTLGKILDVGERRIQTLINQLIQYGHLEKHARYRENGSQGSNFYRTILVGPEKPAEGENPEVSPPLDSPDLPLNGVSSPSSLRSDGALSVSGGLFQESLLPAESCNHAREAKKKVSGPSDEILDEFFDRFWQKYPNKVGKKAARKKFEGILRRQETTMEKLMAGLDRYIRTKPVDRAWCHPTTWLNEGRWDDEPAAANSHAGQNLDYVMGR